MREAADIILAPIITEASMLGAQMRKYTFKVAPDANKIEIKNAVQNQFGVEVSKVNTLQVRGQMRRYRQHEGYSPSWKKAIVTLAPGSKTIEFFEGLY